MSGLGGGQYDTLSRGIAAFREKGRKSFSDFAEIDGIELTTTNEVVKKYSMRRAAVRQRSAINKQTDVSGKVICSSPIGEILRLWYQSSAVNDISQSAESITKQDLEMHSNGWVDMDSNADAVNGRTKPSNVLVVQKTGQDISADDSTDVITVNDHGLLAGDKVRFTTDNALPAGLSADTTYFVVNVTSNTFQVSATKGGEAIDLTSTGTGTNKVHIEYEENRDYAVNENRAMLFAIPAIDGGRIDALRVGQVVSVSADFAEQSQQKMEWLTKTDIRGDLLYSGDATAGVKQEWLAFIQIRPSGNKSYIGDDIQSFELEFDVLQDNPVAPFGTYIDRSGLSLPVPK